MNYEPIIISLRLSREFVSQLQAETECAVLAQDAHTLIPSALLRLATIVTGEISLLSNGNTRQITGAAESR